MERLNKDNDEIEISLTELLHSIWDIRWVIALLVLTGCVTGAILSTGNGSEYEAKASMIVTARTAEGTYQNGSNSPRSEDIYLSQNLTKTVRLLAASDRVLTAALDEEQYTHIRHEEIRERIRVTAEEGTAFLYLTLSWYNQDEAVGILNRLMNILPNTMVEVMDIGSVSIIDFAENAVPVQESIPKHIGMGAIIGLAVGILIGVLYYLFVPKVRGKSSLESLELDLIGEIPELEMKHTNLSCFLEEQKLPQFYIEAYGRLAVVFRYLTEQKQHKIIAVTSSISGEGKSIISYNLALKLTESGLKVLLLDFDFKKGVLYHLARARKPRDGEVRTESRNTDNLCNLVEKMYNGIYTIQGFSQSDIFQVENKIFPAIRQLKEQFDFILIDTPPVGVMSDVQQLRDLIESVLFVVREDTVSIQSVTKSIEFLEQTGISVIGCVLNCGSKPMEYRNYNY